MATFSASRKFIATFYCGVAVILTCNQFMTRGKHCHLQPYKTSDCEQRCSCKGIYRCCVRLPWGANELCSSKLHTVIAWNKFSIKQIPEWNGLGDIFQSAVTWCYLRFSIRCHMLDIEMYILLFSDIYIWVVIENWFTLQLILQQSNIDLALLYRQQIAVDYMCYHAFIYIR